MISHFQFQIIYLISCVTIFSNSSMVTRCVSGKNFDRSTHPSCGVGAALRYNSIYCIRSILFLKIFLSFLSFKTFCWNWNWGAWPPQGVLSFDPFSVPLLNTVILLSSGITVTWAHHALMAGTHLQVKTALLLTCVLGLYFTFLQGLEYIEASFAFSDCAYGSTFFLATGFHGIHVLVGTGFLMVCLSRVLRGRFSHRHHFGFEAAAWYWHFVDVVWLFLYLMIYWWGGC